MESSDSSVEYLNMFLVESDHQMYSLVDPSVDHILLNVQINQNLYIIILFKVKIKFKTIFVFIHKYKVFGIMIKKI
jgi:hypothetical protein